MQYCESQFKFFDSNNMSEVDDKIKNTNNNVTKIFNILIIILSGPMKYNMILCIIMAASNNNDKDLFQLSIFCNNLSDDK